jgi:hypothetical protein
VKVLTADMADVAPRQGKPVGHLNILFIDPCYFHFRPYLDGKKIA